MNLSPKHQDGPYSKYEFLWFEGPQLPTSVKDVILDNQDSEGTFRFATLNGIYDLFSLFKYLLFSVDDEESEYDSDEDPENEENVQHTEYETD